ncbi:MAG: zf-TFIIB domain-containing protein, partial [Aeoliella sp.]
MKCPRDGAELATVFVAGIELDKCHHCDGLWFDRGELERVQKLERTDIEEQLEQQFGDPTVEAGKVEGYMRCPRCPEGRLQQVTYTIEKRVKIDRCEDCLGVWIDDTELDAIIGEKKQLEEIGEGGRIKA